MLSVTGSDPSMLPVSAVRHSSGQFLQSSLKEANESAPNPPKEPYSYGEAGVFPEERSTAVKTMTPLCRPQLHINQQFTADEGEHADSFLGSSQHKHI